VGAAGIFVQLGVLAALTACGMNYLLATALAVEAAVLHNFFWYERFIWADRNIAHGNAKFIAGRLCKFNLCTGALSILGNVVAMKLLVGLTGLPYLPANLLSIAACGIFNYFVADRMIFLAAKNQSR
jgi:putative flippase GtrA